MPPEKAQGPTAGEEPAIPPRLRGERAPLLFAKGALMGVADVVPGVSGGTVALLVGVYERLVAGLNALFSVPARFVRAGPIAARRRLASVPFAFLLVLGAGIASAILVGAHFLPGFIHRYPVLAAALFFGLILGSIPVAWRRIDRPKPREYAIAAFAALVAFFLSGLPSRIVEDPAWWVILPGAAVAVTAMVLPGVSGAYLLLVLGLYAVTLEAISAFDLSYLVPFAIGALLGAVFIVRVITILLARWPRATLAALVGLMIGALRATWPWLDDNRGLLAPPSEFAALLWPLLVFLAGFLLVRGIDVLVGRTLGPQPVGAQK